MTHDISVDSGEVAVASAAAVLRASAIGSCVVVAAYDPTRAVGGMAHVMLPGEYSGEDPARKTRYAEDAIREMIHGLTQLNADMAGMRVFLVGGANVLGEGHDSPGAEIMQSLTGILHRRGIEIAATDVGGWERRSCVLDVARGRVTYTIGDSKQQVLWEAASKVTT